jgi:hypothetical protein
MSDEATIRFLLEGGEEPSAPAPVQPQRPTQIYPAERDPYQRIRRIEKPPDVFGDFKQAMRPAMRGVVGQLVSAGLDLVNALTRIKQKGIEELAKPTPRPLGPRLPTAAPPEPLPAHAPEPFKLEPEEVLPTAPRVQRVAEETVPHNFPKPYALEPEVKDVLPVPPPRDAGPMMAGATEAESTRLYQRSKKTQLEPATYGMEPLNKQEPPAPPEPIRRRAAAEEVEPYNLAPLEVKPKKPPKPAGPAGPQQLKATNVGAASAEGATELEAVTPALSESLAAAIPIVGAVAAGFMIVNQAMKDFRDKMVGGVAAAGQFVGYLASADTKIATPLENTGEGLKTFGDKLWALNPAASTLTMMVGESVKQFGALTRELDATTKRYAQYNPQLAVSDAMRDMRMTLGDLRRAQVVGPNLAKYNDATSRLENQLEDAKAALLNQLLPVVTAIVEGISDVVTGVEATAVAVALLAEHPFDPVLVGKELARVMDRLNKEKMDMEKWETMMQALSAVQPIDVGKLADLAGAFKPGAEGGV